MSSLWRDLRRLVLLGLASLLPAVAQSQTTLIPAGAETLLSGGLRGNQVNPALSVSDSGGFVVWQDNNAAGGSGWGIQARRLDAQGGSLADLPFRVNSAAAATQERPQVAALPGGGAFFVWQGGPVGFATIYARLMGPHGFLSSDLLASRPLIAATNRASALMPVIRNNRPTIRRFIFSKVTAQRRDFASGPVVTALADRSVIIAYAAYQRFTTNAPIALPETRVYGSQTVVNSILVPQVRSQDFMLEVFFRRYLPTGEAIGNEVRVNQEREFNQRNPALAALANGNLVVVWVSENQGVSGSDLAAGKGRQDVYARLFNAGGAVLGDEFRVNDAARPENTFPAVAALAGGGFRVVWTQRASNPADGLDIVTRAFAADGSPASDTWRLNTYTPGDQYGPKLAACPAGELVVWTSINQDGSNEGVFGRWISGDVPGSDEFCVNTTTAGSQYQPAVVAVGNQFVVAWAGLRPGSGFDIFGQRYSAGNR